MAEQLEVARSNRIRATIWLPPGLEASDIIWDEPQRPRTKAPVCAKRRTRRVTSPSAPKASTQANVVVEAL
jgi:hypothetical protein